MENLSGIVFYTSTLINCILTLTYKN